MTNLYRKSVRHLDEIDIYQIGNLYEVNSHAVFHALKKLLCAGKRGAKDYEQDLMEAIESIERELQMVELNAGHLPDGEGWIEWKKGSSINSDEYPFVEVKLANGKIRMGKPSAYEWYVRGLPDDIVAYRKAGGMPHVDPEPDWCQRHPDLRFAVRGENGQFVFTKDQPSSGTFWIRPDDFDEQRIDVIGQNGNEGEHYVNPWKQHIGGLCPVAPGLRIDVMYRNGAIANGLVTGESLGLSGNAYWRHDDSPGDIVAYRLA